MSRRRVALSLVLSVFCAAEARPQAVEIDHKAVGCIVVGKYPKLNACFTPAANLARARVYFRPEGTPSWYYVDMKSDQPCFMGVLPRPGKKLIGKKIEYYVEGQDKTFNAGRTAEYGPIVVKSAQECKKEAPAAPFLNNATVAVFPALPAGFIGGGIGTGAIIGVAAAGAAAAGTAAVVASNNDSTTTTVAVGVNTTTTIVAATTTTTTQPKAGNRAPFAVLSTNPDPPSGQSPLTVIFDLCKSTDPDGDPLSFFYNFGDGAKASGSCVESHTYQAAFRAASGVRAQDASYTATARVSDPGGLSAERTRTVNVGSPAAACATPTVVLSPPPDGVSCSPVNIRASTTNTDTVTFCSQQVTNVDLCNTSLPRAAQGKGSVTSAAAAEALNCVQANRNGANFRGDVPLSDGRGCYQISAEARNECGNVGGAPFRYVYNFDFCSDLVAQGKGDDRTAVWSSDLAMEGGRLQLVVNGGSPAFPGRGRGFGSARLSEGENRIEAVLVESAGKPGLWRIDLKPSEAIVAGSLRVITGEVVLLGPAAATFRLSGAQGERVVFTFLKK